MAVRIAVHQRLVRSCQQCFVVAAKQGMKEMEAPAVQRPNLRRRMYLCPGLDIASMSEIRLDRKIGKAA